MVCVLVQVSLWWRYPFDFDVPVCIQSWRGQEGKNKNGIFPSISSRFNGRMSKKRDSRGIYTKYAVQQPCSERTPRWIYPTIVFLYQQLERVYVQPPNPPTSSFFLMASSLWQWFPGGGTLRLTSSPTTYPFETDFFKSSAFIILFSFFTKSTLTFETSWGRDSMSFI